MTLSRAALLGGPAFFILWFMGAQVLYFAGGGTMDESPRPAPGEFPAVLLANRSSAYLGATLLLLAGASLLAFAAGVRGRLGSVRGLELLAVLATAGIAMLLVLEGGLVIASVDMAASKAEFAWLVDQLSGAVGFESVGTSFLGAAAVIGVLAAVPRKTVPRWFWWLSLVFGVVLAMGAILEGLAVVPGGRFSILFGLWVAIAGFALMSDPSTDKTSR